MPAASVRATGTGSPEPESPTTLQPTTVTNCRGPVWMSRPGRVCSRQVGAEAHSQQGTSRYTVLGTHFVTV
jgi:hypothetical protein